MLVSRIRKSLSKLYVQVLIGIIAGILVGHFFPDIGSTLKPLGDLFIKLIRMLLGSDHLRVRRRGYRPHARSS